MRGISMRASWPHGWTITCPIWSIFRIHGMMKNPNPTPHPMQPDDMQSRLDNLLRMQRHVRMLARIYWCLLAGVVGFDIWLLVKPSHSVPFMCT